MDHTDLARRAFLRSAARLGGGVIASPSLFGLMACVDASPSRAGTAMAKSRVAGGYGDLVACQDYPEISIPRGFQAMRVGQAGDFLSDNNMLKNAFDGMGAFSMGGDRVRLVRNHEHRDLPGRYDPPSPVNVYDPKCNAGTSTVELTVHADGSVKFERAWVSLSGTAVNCAGGVTPWGSWISCEEHVGGTGDGYARNHGYAFEVPAAAEGPVVPVPLKAMGRFTHEAVAVDPDTWFVYETEDRDPAGFYRFTPKVRGQLAEGGTLDMLAIRGKRRYDTRRGQRVGTVRDCEWVRIEKPDSDEGTLGSGYCFNQGHAKGGATFARLEGCFWGDDSAYIVSTSGGDARAGQVWRYIPDARGGKLVLVFESPSQDVLDSPDNVCVSPRGGIVLCEDNGGTNYVRGVTKQGEVFDFVRNNANRSEWAGVCFSPQGRTLFVNMQGSTSEASTTLGSTYAIWGPWENGAL